MMHSVQGLISIRYFCVCWVGGGGLDDWGRYLFYRICSYILGKGWHASENIIAFKKRIIRQYFLNVWIIFFNTKYSAWLILWVGGMKKVKCSTHPTLLHTHTHLFFFLQKMQLKFKSINMILIDGKRLPAVKVILQQLLD